LLCFTGDNLAKLKIGASATISVGVHKGELVEVDHLVPKSLVPALAKDFANLRFVPKSVNRTKSDLIRWPVLQAVKIFVRHGLISETAVNPVQNLAENRMSVRSAKAILPGHTSHLASLPVLANFAAGATDPRLIISRMGQLIDRIRDWEPRADSAVTFAELTQRHTSEHATRTNSLLRHAQSRVRDDSDSAKILEAELEKWFQRGKIDMLRAGVCEQNALTACKRARQATQTWKHELHLANVWQGRAEYRENMARQEVERAEDALNRAQNALSRAEEQLEKARNQTKVVGRDSEGKAIREPIDTTPFEERVAEAQERLERCEERLERAQDELGRATAEREAAEARVNSCTHAVSLADQAEAAAAASLTSAKNGIAAVERASEEHIRATHFVRQVTDSLSNLQQAVLSMAKRITAASGHESDARSSLLTCQRHHASARFDSTKGCMEISWRMDQLSAFDRHITEF